MLFFRQIKGIIATCILMAFIPFFHFTLQRSHDFQGPMFSQSGKNKISVAINGDDGKSGIYFVDHATTLEHLLREIDSSIITANDYKLKDGVSVKLKSEGKQSTVVIEEMTAEQRIALGLPLDINKAALEDLMLVPGIGESTAQKIIDRRREIGKYGSLEQLTEINGIKERKLIKLSKYLYLEK